MKNKNFFFFWITLAYSWGHLLQNDPLSMKPNSLELIEIFHSNF